MLPDRDDAADRHRRLPARGGFDTPIRGIYELVEILLAYTFFMALPAVFLRDENIVVNIIDDLAPRAVPALSRGAGLLGVFVLAVMAWQGWLAALDTLAFNDVTRISACRAGCTGSRCLWA